MLGVGDTKCGICKPKLGIYKPYWAVRRIGCNFAAFLSFASETVRNGVYNCQIVRILNDFLMILMLI